MKKTALASWLSGLPDNQKHSRALSPCPLTAPPSPPSPSLRYSPRGQGIKRKLCLDPQDLQGNGLQRRKVRVTRRALQAVSANIVEHRVSIVILKHSFHSVFLTILIRYTADRYVSSLDTSETDSNHPSLLLLHLLRQKLRRELLPLYYLYYIHRAMEAKHERREYPSLTRDEWHVVSWPWSAGQVSRLLGEDPRHRWWRKILYICHGIVSAVPGIHGQKFIGE